MDVTIYTTPDCPHCTTAKRFLAQRGVRYLEKDVSRDERAALEMIRRSGQRGVPVIVLDGQVVVGFDRGRLEAILSRPPRARPSLGAQVATAEVQARKRGMMLPPGAYVGQVAPGSAAERVGLCQGDVIVGFGGVSVRGVGDLERALAALVPGQAVEVIWWRGGRELRGRAEL